MFYLSAFCEDPCCIPLFLTPILSFFARFAFTFHLLPTLVLSRLAVLISAPLVISSVSAAVAQDRPIHVDSDSSADTKFDMKALAQCQDSCEDELTLQDYATTSWKLVLSVPEYRQKWESLKKLLGGGAELQSLADLSAAQVKKLFDKLGIDTNSPFINAQMQGIYADTFYDEELVEGEVAADPSNPGSSEIVSAQESWAEALTWISELTEVQEDAIDDKIDICYEACSESHPMVFSFDADAEGFPELDMWVSSILRQ